MLVHPKPVVLDDDQRLQRLESQEAAYAIRPSTGARNKRHGGQCEREVRPQHRPHASRVRNRNRWHSSKKGQQMGVACTVEDRLEGRVLAPEDERQDVDEARGSRRRRGGPGRRGSRRRSGGRRRPRATSPARRDSRRAAPAGPHAPRSRGSRASRRPSPRRLKPSTASMMASPGIVVMCGSDQQEVAPRRHHEPPGRRGWLDPEPEERERRLDQDRVRHEERAVDDHGRQDVRQDVAADQRGPRRAQRAGRPDVLGLGQREHGAADDPGRRAACPRCRPRSSC